MDPDDSDYFVQREILDAERLDEVAQKGTRSSKPTAAERLKDSFRCSASRLGLAVLARVPVLGWLPRYAVRENLLGDVISGCSVAVMHLPQGLAYASLAGLRPVFGLYTSFYPVLVYFLFGTSRHISIGTFAVTSIMVGSVVQRLAPDAGPAANGTNQTAGDADALDADRVRVAASFAVLTGLVQILLGAVRFGFMVTYLSGPMIRAYTTGSAVLVCVSQLKDIFGVRPSRFTGPLSAVYTLIDICRLLPETNLAQLLVSAVALVALVVIKEINACYRTKLPLPVPVELLLIIAATLAAHFGSLNVNYGVSVVGEIPSGLRAPLAPDATLFTQMMGDALAVAVVSYTITISLAKTFALKHSYKVDSNQELVALGLSNAVGGCFLCYPVTASMSRTLVQETTGARTQVAGIFSSVILLVAILELGPLFENLPKAILAAIVIVNLKGMFMQAVDVRMLWRTNKADLLVWLVTFTSTVLLNLDLGLAVSVGFAMFTLILRMQRPQYSILGHVSGTDLYLDTDTYKEAKEITGIKIFRSSTTINYTNAEMFVDALQDKSGIDFGKLLLAKRKQEAALKSEQEKEKKTQKTGVELLSSGTFTFKEFNREELSERPRSQNADTGRHGDYTINQTSSHCDEEAVRSDTHSIVLDLSATSFVDTVSVNTLKNIFSNLGQIQLNVYLAGCQGKSDAARQSPGRARFSRTRALKRCLGLSSVLSVEPQRLTHNDKMISPPHASFRQRASWSSWRLLVSSPSPSQRAGCSSRFTTPCFLF
ncbi:solute carrier family 26 member 6-like isoform X2 [Betta splendens]|uniref:Solute carrier family 26 member 6-like isoform X2 n=1 Tax=Betta splendens TaxID=158456 RepID=A0A9W2XX60_BETSP|nr:solute carrier family 26 member 6-like isoform X2 [Betta splendens]